MHFKIFFTIIDEEESRLWTVHLIVLICTNGKIYNHKTEMINSFKENDHINLHYEIKMSMHLIKSNSYESRVRKRIMLRY